MGNSSGSAVRDVEQAAQSVWIARLARFGFGVRGVLYLLLGYLSTRVAFGQPGRETDRNGALGTIAREPFGHAIVVALAAGFAGSSVWQFSVATCGGSLAQGLIDPDGASLLSRMA